jgi:hypothetical protein
MPRHLHGDHFIFYYTMRFPQLARPKLGLGPEVMSLNPTNA